MKKSSTKAKTRTVGKSELATALGWARPRLDRRLNDDASFPVKRRGTRAGGWEFDVAAVLAYLGQTEPAPEPVAAAPRAPAPARKPSPAPVADRQPSGAGGAPGVQHQGELTASQRHKLAQALLLEDKLRVSRGELVETEEVRMVLGTMLAHLGKGLDGLPDTVVRRLELSEESLPVLQGLVDELRRNMATDLQGLLQ